MQSDVRAIFEKHAGFQQLRPVRKEFGLLIFVEFEFSQAAYDAIDEFVDGFEVSSSTTKGKVEFATDDRRNPANQRSPPLERLQPRQILRRPSDNQGSPTAKRECVDSGRTKTSKKSARTRSSSPSSSSSSSDSDSDTES